VNLVVGKTGAPFVLIRLRLSRERLRHETNLRVRPKAARKIRVENAVNDAPVVSGPAHGIFVIRASRTPLECRSAVTRREQIVGAEIDLRTAEFAEVGE